MDYKSNYLGEDHRAYGLKAMADAMLAHRYDLQYVLYTLALHRLLKARLPHYRYRRDMGGAVYLFLRGVAPDGNGVYAHKPPRRSLKDWMKILPAGRGTPLKPDLSNLLEDWVAVGWLRPLDDAFARFLKAQAPETSEPVLLLAALTSHQVGRGHICLDLRAMLSTRENPVVAPRGTAGRKNVRSVPECSDGHFPVVSGRLSSGIALVAPGSGNTPLVLEAGLLYMRRYWQYTRSVAENILDRLTHESPVPDNLSERLGQLFEPLRGDREKGQGPNRLAECGHRHCGKEGVLRDFRRARNRKKPPPWFICWRFCSNRHWKRGKNCEFAWRPPREKPLRV